MSVSLLLQNKMAVYHRPSSGMPNEETLNSIVFDIVSELHVSMLGFNLYKSAQLEVMKHAAELIEPNQSVIEFLTDSAWEECLYNAVYLHLQTYSVKLHSFLSADHIKEPISYIRRAQVIHCCTVY